MQVMYWFMSICRKTLKDEKLDWLFADRLKRLLSIGHDIVRMQARNYKATLPYVEVGDGFAPPPRK
ncbi:hypothetical protein ES702_06325 [subsurface metagenome]